MVGIKTFLLRIRGGVVWELGASKKLRMRLTRGGGSGYDNVVGRRHQPRSTVVRAQGLISQGSGFDPDLFSKAYYMPFTSRWWFEIKQRI